MAFCDSYDEFVKELESLKNRDYTLDSVADFENASLVDKLRHWAYCKQNNKDCSLSFLNNAKLEAKIESCFEQGKKVNGGFLAVLYVNLYEFEECFSTENKGRVNRWNLFETASDSELNDLRNQLKEKDKIIQDLTEKSNTTENEHKDDFRSLLRSILLDDF